jgi:hypothetical protein|tara:strand:- start:1734 stop:1934 length:201 start_codon:yes stop_codon:yes gene_type:complete
MWNWRHLSGESWLKHTMRSAKFSGLLLLSGSAMILHLLIPFWQQPEWLQAKSVANSLCEGMEKGKD